MARTTVLVPLDGSAFSRQILPIVRRMLRADEYAVTLLRVADQPKVAAVEPPQYVPVEHGVPVLALSATSAERTGRPVDRSQVEASARVALEAELRQDVYFLEAAGFVVTVEVRFGDPACAIADFVHESAIDLVAMATHGRGGLPRLVLGSVAEHVLRHVVIPVLLWRPVAEPIGQAAR